MRFTFSKKEKLKSKKLIEQLFNEGRSLSTYPLRLVYLKTEFTETVPIKTGVSVSKRYFKNAVDRNHLKRLMREAYRLNKHQLFNKISTQYAFMILYIGQDQTNFATIENSMQKLFTKFITSQNLTDKN